MKIVAIATPAITILVSSKATSVVTGDWLAAVGGKLLRSLPAVTGDWLAAMAPFSVPDLGVYTSITCPRHHDLFRAYTRMHDVSAGAAKE